MAPYRVHRVITSVDAAGWRPSQGELDKYGREIPDEEYQTKDFEKVVALKKRTEAIAAHITEFLKKTDRFAKTIVFCVDQEHADEMRKAINNLNADLVQKYPDYVCRVTADEGGIGKGHLSNFQELETVTPVVLTTSQLLTTGVDAPMVKNVALVRVVGSISEFKQIIGRGTRVREDYGKLFFSILDYTGTATRHFADPDFDGDPELITETTIDDDGNVIDEEIVDDGPIIDGPTEDDEDDDGDEVIIDGPGPVIVDPPPPERHKYYVEGGHVEVAHQVVYEMDASGNQLRVIEFTDYTAEAVRSLFRDVEELRDRWASPSHREEVAQRLAERGIDFDHLADVTGNKDADAFDLLCHLAFDAPLRTRRERAERLPLNLVLGVVRFHFNLGRLLALATGRNEEQRQRAHHNQRAQPFHLSASTNTPLVSERRSVRTFRHSPPHSCCLRITARYQTSQFFDMPAAEQSGATLAHCTPHHITSISCFSRHSPLHYLHAQCSQYGGFGPS